MTLNFPNAARNYDEVRDCIRFTGYDGVFEVPFFLDVSAIPLKQQSEATGEKKYLTAFDMCREKIEAAARKLYGRGGQTTYRLTTAHF